MSCSFAPSNTGVEMLIPRTFAASDKWISSTPVRCSFEKERRERVKNDIERSSVR